MDRVGPAAAGTAARAGIGFTAERRSDTSSPRHSSIAPDTATAAGFGGWPAPRRMLLRKWRPLVRNTLRGFADVELPSGLQIDEIAVHVRNGRAWASLPARPMLDADGRHVVREGEPQYASIMRWRTRELADRWSATVVELVREANPDGLDGGGQ